MSDTNFVEGMNAFKPSDAAPDFIKVNLSIKVAELRNWLMVQTPDAKGYIRVVVKESKGGKYYAQLDSYTPKGEAPTGNEEPTDDINPEDLSF